MIIISDTLVPSKEMMQAVIRGMRNPYNSWDKSDNGGPKDHELMLKLAHAGNSNPSHTQQVQAHDGCVHRCNSSVLLVERV